MNKMAVEKWNIYQQIMWRLLTKLTTRPVLKCTVWVAEETLNQTMECPVLAQFIDQAMFLITKYTNQC